MTVANVSGRCILLSKQVLGGIRASGASSGPADALTATATTIHERKGPFDRLTTPAGEIAFAQVNGTKTLTLAGKHIDSQADGDINIENAFDMSDHRTVLLLSVSSGGVACPSVYYFVTIRPDGSTSSTDSFGTCSDLPKVSLTTDGIMVNAG